MRLLNLEERPGLHAIPRNPRRPYHYPSIRKDLQEVNYRLVDRSQKPFYLMFMIQRRLTLVLNLITMGLAVVVVGIAVGLRGSISPGFTGVALT